MPRSHQNLDLFANAFTYSSVGMALVSLDGLFLDVNPAMCRSIGYAKKEMLTRTFQDITHPEDLEQDLELVNKVIQGEIASYSLEKRYIHIRGHSVWCLLTVSLCRDQDGKPEFFISQILDISQQKRAESDRDAFFSLSPDLLAIANANGYLIQVNPAWTDLLGWTAEELCSRPYLDFVHPDDIERTLQQGQAEFSGKEPAERFRSRYRHRDGSFRWLEWNARVVSEELIYCAVRDISQQIEDSERIHSQDERIRLLIENASDAFVGISEDGAITEWNKQAETCFGWRAEDVIGKPMVDLLPPDRFKQQHLDGMKNFLQMGGRQIAKRVVDLPVCRRDGSELLVEMTVGSILYKDRHYFHAFFRDVSEQRALAKRLHHQATHDYLTDLPNRFEFMSTLQRVIHAAERQTRPPNMALLFIDLDGFKNVNDTYGHEVGDTVLIEFGHRLSKAVRKSDFVARLSGDEFVVLLNDLVYPEADATMISNKILDASRLPFTHGSKQCEIGSSVGVAFYRLNDTANELLTKADSAMYMAKQAGKNRVAFFHINS